MRGGLNRGFTVPMYSIKSIMNSSGRNFNSVRVSYKLDVLDSFTTNNLSDFKLTILQCDCFYMLWFKIVECCNFTILAVFGTILVTRLSLATLNSRLNTGNWIVCMHIQCNRVLQFHHPNENFFFFFFLGGGGGAV